jgi:DNA-binding NarL/FixJ family response regulator
MLLERRTELAEADRALRAGLAGTGSLAVVTGPPGVGKSALLREVSESATSMGARVLRADGTMAEQDVAYGVVQQLLQPLVAGSSDADRALWFDGAARSVRRMFVDESWSIDDPPRASTRETVLRGLHSLVARVAEQAATVLVVDDLQWADAPSLRWLGYLAKRLDGARIVVLGVACDSCVPTDAALLGEIVTSAGYVLQPAPLSVDGVRDLAGEEFGEECAPEFARACHEVSCGFPASVLPVVRGLHAQDVRPLARHAPEVSERSQPLLCELRMFQLSTQPDAVRDFARAMAVLDDLAEPDLVGALAGLDRVAYKSALQALDRIGLLAGTSELRFAHTSVQLAVESAMTVTERTRMHRKAATLLHDAGHSAEHVADQLLQITFGYEHWEIDALRAAAGTALERAAGKAAARYLRRALLDSPADGGDRARLLVDLAGAERGFDLASSVRHLSQALQVLRRPAERAAAALWIPPALAAADQGLAALVHEVSAGLAAADPAGTYRDLALRLEARGRYLGLQDDGQLADATRRVADLAARPPVTTAAGRELVAVLVFAATVTSAVSATDVAADAPPVAMSWLRSTADKARDQESAGVRALVDAEWATMLNATGQLGTARSLALGALTAADQTWPEAVALATATLADIALVTQDVELAEQVLATGRESDDLRVVVAHRMLRGLVDLARSRFAQALDRFLDCGNRLGRGGWTNPALCPWRIWAAAAHERLGDTGSARALAEQEHAAALVWDAHATSGRALRTLAALTRGGDGVDLLRTAVARLGSSADRIEHARALAMLGARLSQDDPTESRELFARAERILAEYGAAWTESVPENTVHGPVPRLTTASRIVLSRTERMVAELVVDGWTNQRIADSLGVTRRAVEKNLTGVYRKLGVAGRAALAAALSELADAPHQWGVRR